MVHQLGHLAQSQEQRDAVTSATGIDTITGETLTDTPTLDFETEPIVSGSDISGLDTTLPEVETPFTDKADDFISDFLANQDLLSGKSAFESGVREDVGLSGLRTQQEDLTAQIEGFQRQSLALQNEFNLAGERIQQQSIGRGRTAGGVAPLTAAAQRRITLRQADIASQALTTSALLSATQGRIGTAQRLVQEAVDKKFGPALEAQEAIIQNLNVLQASGVLTREENEKAEAQKAKKEAAKAKIEEEKADALQGENLLIDVALTGTASQQELATIRQAIDSGDIVEAARLASQFLQAGVELNTKTVEVDGRIKLINTQTGETIKDLGAADVVGAGGSVIGISPITGKPFTDSQSKAATFAVRMEQSEDLLSLGKEFADVALIQAFKSNERRQFEQAEKNFITALLRRESGAAIAPDEFVSARLVYVPQFNDDDITLARKTEARRTAFQGLKNESVGSFDQLKTTLDAALPSPPVEGLTADELDEINEVPEVNPETGLFEESDLFNFFPNLNQ